MSLLTELGHGYEDFGCYDTSSVDYPDVSLPVAEAVSQGKGFEHGVLICSTGVGMSIAANKVRGVRAALCHDTFCARRSRFERLSVTIHSAPDVPENTTMPTYSVSANRSSARVLPVT